MGRLFGADGIKGIAVTEFTCEKAMQIGRAAAVVLGARKGHKARFIVGKDTRISSDILESALISGILSVGADVVTTGIIPSPGLAYLVKDSGADAGIMITSSNADADYNGVKLFSSGGYKISETVEEEIEALLLDDPDKINEYLKHGSESGRLYRNDSAVDRYVEHILKTFDGDFSGMIIAVDCANGSATATAEKLFSRLGAKVFLLNCDPDGVNIVDNCSPTGIQSLIDFVKDNSCDLGIAFDGDADRCIAVDENGSVMDGDKLIALFAKDMKERGVLAENTVVITVMSNHGLSLFARENGIKAVTTKVGDRYITEQMNASGYSLGGEQSGHIIFGDHSTTGDGQLTAVQLLSVIKRGGKKLSSYSDIIERFPQVIINVRISPKWKEIWKNIEAIEEIIESNEKVLGTDGRIIVRESRTEPVIRVMTEGKDFETASSIALAVADVIKKNCPAD